MENLVKAGEVAVMVNVSVQTVYRYVMNKEIPFIKLGRAVRFSPSEISGWLDSRKKGKSVNLNCVKAAEITESEKVDFAPDFDGTQNAGV